MPNTTSDVTIIGAGIAGISAAFHLAEAGICDVTVLEEEHGPGMKSSGRSGSMLMKSRENMPKIAMSLYSYDWYMNFPDRFDERLDFTRTGFLSLVDEDTADRLRREHALRLSMGVPSELLTPEQISDVCPGIQPEGLEFGVICEDDGVINPSQIMGAMLHSARQKGVRFLFGDSVHASWKDASGRFVIDSDGGRTTSHTLVIAGGTNARKMGLWFDEELPILNRRRSLFFGHCPSANFQGGPMVEEASREWYYRGLGGSTVMLGMGLEPADVQLDEPNEPVLAELRAALTARAPDLAGFTVESGVAGIRQLTPDILPIVGPARKTENLHFSCGWGGEGVMHAPAGGVMLVGNILGTPPAELPWRDVLPVRFGSD